jgi:hypothetical protein
MITINMVPTQKWETFAMLRATHCCTKNSAYSFTLAASAFLTPAAKTGTVRSLSAIFMLMVWEMGWCMGLPTYGFVLAIQIVAFQEGMMS